MLSTTWSCTVTSQTRFSSKAKGGRFGAQVRVGSLCDPKALPGLAHFTEHMLFYASAKYPDEDAYSKFLVCHSIANLHIYCWMSAFR